MCSVHGDGMTDFLLLRRLFAIFCVVLWTARADAQVVNYDIVAVKAPRYGDSTLTTWQDVTNPASVEPGQDLVYIYADGHEETLVQCSDPTSPKNFNRLYLPEHAGKSCAVTDPCVSFDARYVYFSVLPQADHKAYSSDGLPLEGADIWRMELATGSITRLTSQEWSPNTMFPKWASDPQNSRHEQGKYGAREGIFNVGACPIAGPNPGIEEIVFASSRDYKVPPRGLTTPNLKLFRMDWSGKNVREIGHLNVGSAMHPTPLADGRIMFSSLESMGNHYDINWGLWAMFPDGRKWAPLFSALNNSIAAHFQTQLSDGRIAVVLYYNLNDNGFGTLVAFPSEQRADQPNFGSPDPHDPTNPLIQEGFGDFGPTNPHYRQFSFSPVGLHTLTAFSRSDDFASPIHPITGTWAGKVTHPSAAPNNDVLLIWSPGPDNDLDRPTHLPAYYGQIRLLRGGIAVDDPRNLVLVRADPRFNYEQPKAVVPYRAVHGIDEPPYIPYLPDGETPFGYVGTASFYNRNTAPGIGSAAYDGLDPFNSPDLGSNFTSQGADAGKYANRDIYAVRVLATEPITGIEGGYKAFSNYSGEKIRILGEIPLRKPDGQGNQPLDGDGNPDTSFLARIPADTPFTFATIDKRGMNLNFSQTWHQIRPGETRADCGGCHAHARKPTDFSQTVAGRSDYLPWDLIDRMPLLSRDRTGDTEVIELTGDQRKAKLDVEYVRDIKPILQRSCAGCHSASSPGGPAARLDLGDESLNWEGLEKTFRCLTRAGNDDHCDGIPLVLDGKVSAVRWVRRFQSRRSLLIWKLFGERLDGWTNSDHPTESVPGDVSTLPPGSDKRLADIDFIGTIMPPPGSGYPPLTEDEKMLFVRWIDTGCTSDSTWSGQEPFNYLTSRIDDTRPTLNVAWPRPEVNASLQRLSFAAYDYLSGLKPASTVVTADFTVNGQAPGANLAPLFHETAQNLWTLSLDSTMTSLPSGTLHVEVADNAGNTTRQDVVFSVDPSGRKQPPQPPNFPPGRPPGGGGGGSGGGGSGPISLTMQEGTITVPLTTGKHGKVRRVKMSLTAVVRNVSLPPKTKVMLQSVGSGRAAIGAANKRVRFNLKKNVKSVRYSFTFKKAGQYVFEADLLYPGGTVSRRVTFIVTQP